MADPAAEYSVYELGAQLAEVRAERDRLLNTLRQLWELADEHSILRDIIATDHTDLHQKWLAAQEPSDAAPLENEPCEYGCDGPCKRLDHWKDRAAYWHAVAEEWRARLEKRGTGV